MSPAGPAGNQNTAGVRMKGKIESESILLFLLIINKFQKNRKNELPV